MSDSDSYLSYPSDEEDMPCCPFDLDPMSSESSDESPDNVSIKVLKGQADAHFENPDTSYLEKLQSRQEDDCVFFPLKLEIYLSDNHQCIIDGLKGLGYDQSFVYIGRSLVVSLNVDNDRIKVPKQLICDTIIFAHNRPVTVLSFVRTNDKPEKYALYNSLLSRHITKIMRTSLHENISVISGVVEEQGEIKKRIEEFEDRATLFSIAGPHQMNESRSRAAATSILQAAAECKAASLIDMGSEKEGAVYMLSKLEFEEMVDVINDAGVLSQNSITFQNILVALESLCRLSKVCAIRVHFQELTEYMSEDQHTVLRKHYPNLDIGPRMQGYGTVLESSLPVASDKDSLNSEGSVSVSDHNTELVYLLTRKVVPSPQKGNLAISSANAVEYQITSQSFRKSRNVVIFKSMQHVRAKPIPGKIKRAQSMLERYQFTIDEWHFM
ncbi:uncharacterized protein LOC124283629 isoform X2 [Haliotis rubra]|uniref:uncharacterized protein LOC124283629 isoform X2 n=1 Tax=Haliotis rubra TaxID=36100 RepID=UPI001EE4FD59|nr:uncharacterized protein LOC124283629 isoform X2 [Haliotis rubra]